MSEAPLLSAFVAVLLAAATGQDPSPLPEPLPPPLSGGASTRVSPTPGNGSAGLDHAGALRPPLASDDPLDVLWGHRVRFTARGEPLITIRLQEGLAEVAVRARGPSRLLSRDHQQTVVAAGERIVLRALESRPAVLAYHPQLGDAVHADRRRLAELRARWVARGVAVRERVTGGVYGIAGRVVDTRRSILIAEGDGSAASARAFAEEALARHGARTATFVEVVERSTGRVEARFRGGSATGEGILTLEVEDDAGFVVEEQREEGGTRREERSYRGRLHVALDASGRLAVVLDLGLEELLRGLVPSEIPAGASPAALAAQAVAARSNVLAQLGTRHLDAPWLICDEVHCQAYRGEGAETAATDAAVRATAGEALFGRQDRRLVDGVYSAVCGGHGEDDDAVWPVLATPALRGRLDLPAVEASAPRFADLRDELALRDFLMASPRSWCARARGLPPRRYRWERRLDAEELERLTGALRVGRVRQLTVTTRGVSGRARALLVIGDAGRAVVEGELAIRRLLGNLPSAMFVVDRDDGALVLHGGGWGHGVGMCQWGAIGRAEAGQDYRQILAAYYSGAEVVRMY